MLDCINKDCRDNLEGRCQDEEINNNKANCTIRIKPVHMLNYVEKNRCCTKECESNDKNGLCNNILLKYCSDRNTEQPAPINYEEEYKKLKKEIEELKNNFNKVSISQEERLSSAYNERVQFISDRNKFIAENKSLRCQLEECKKTVEIKNKYIKELEEKIERYKQGIEWTEKDIEKLCDNEEKLKDKNEKQKHTINNQMEEIESLKLLLSDNGIGNKDKKPENQILRETIKKLAEML